MSDAEGGHSPDRLPSHDPEHQPERHPTWPPRRASDVPDAMLLRLLRIITLVAAVIIFVIWYVDDSQGMTTPWESHGGPVLGLLFLTGGILLWVRPAWLTAIVATCLSAAGVFFLGCLHFAVAEGGSKGLYSMASNAQFMPLVYVAAFITLKRGAAALCWLLCLLMMLMYVLQYGCLDWQGWRRLMPRPDDIIAHTWFTLLLTHPCYILALQYITMLKSRLLQSERQAHDDKKRFLAMLSHEMRSPLQAMLGSIDLLAMKVHSPPERRAVDRLRHATGQLDAHLRDITEFTRLEDPAWRLELDRVDLVELTRDVCEAWQPQASAKGLTLHCDLAPQEHEPLRRVYTDPQRVRQVLVNLVSNAVKYTPSGHITVRAFMPGGGELCVIEVADTGIGIPQAELSRIFEPYVRLEDPRAGGSEGSGLGLAVVQRLVDRLGGELHVESLAERGSCFTVRLPQPPA